MRVGEAGLEPLERPLRSYSVSSTLGTRRHPAQRLDTANHSTLHLTAMIIQSTCHLVTDDMETRKQNMVLRCI